MKRSDLKRIIKEEVQKVLKEYTNMNFSGRKELSDIARRKPDMFGQQIFDELFPMGAKSESAAIRALKNYDMISQRSPMFVHVQYHYFEDKEGTPYFVHEQQYYNSNFQDARNPRVTILTLEKNPNSENEEEIGQMLVKTEDYIKDLKRLKITKSS
tara:strand:- start:311 stop:778 length:468 start_codon:yes stop_codon:yes gene_type:complete